MPGWREPGVSCAPVAIALDAAGYGSLADWTQVLARDAARFAAQHHADRRLPRDGDARGPVGHCTACGRPARFGLPSLAAGRPTALREELVCTGCGLNARVRAAYALLEQALLEQASPTHAPPDRAVPDARSPDQAGPGRAARIYITEQASRNFVWLQRHFRSVVGSEFVSGRVARLRLALALHRFGGRGWIRFEDVTALRLDDASVDAVVSFDVLEHVPDYRRALAEFARVLRAGGVLVLTAPFLSHAATTLVRARIDARGVVEHLLPAEYHGDPVSGGVLCYYHFGWDLLDACRAAGFRSAQMVRSWQPELGFAGELWTLRARR